MCLMVIARPLGLHVLVMICRVDGKSIWSWAECYASYFNSWQNTFLFVK